MSRCTMSGVVVGRPLNRASPASFGRQRLQGLLPLPPSLDYGALGQIPLRHSTQRFHLSCYKSGLSAHVEAAERIKGFSACCRPGEGSRSSSGNSHGAIDGGKWRRRSTKADVENGGLGGRGFSEEAGMMDVRAEASEDQAEARERNEASPIPQSSGGVDFERAAGRLEKPTSESRNGAEDKQEQGGRKESVLERAMGRAKAASDGQLNGGTGPLRDVTSGVENLLNGAEGYSFADGPLDTVREDEIDDVIAEIGGAFNGEDPLVEMSPLDLTPEEAVAMLPVGLMNRGREVREFYEEKERAGAVDRGTVGPPFDGKLDLEELRKRARWAEYGNEKGERIIGEGPVTEDVEERWMVDLEDEEKKDRERAASAAQSRAVKEGAERELDGSNRTDIGASDASTVKQSEETLRAVHEYPKPSGSFALPEAPSTSEEEVETLPDAHALFAESSERVSSAEAAQDLRTVPLDEFGDPVWDHQSEAEKPTTEEYEMAVGDLPPDLVAHLKKAQERRTEQDVEVIEWGYDQVSGQQVPKWRQKLEAEEAAKKEAEKAQLEDYIFRKKLFSYAEKKGVKITETRHVYDEEGREISRDGKPVADVEAQSEEPREDGREEQKYQYVRPDWEAPMEPFPDSDYSDLSDSDDEDESDGEEDVKNVAGAAEARLGLEVSDAVGVSPRVAETDGEVGDRLMDGYETMAGAPGHRAVLRTAREESVASESGVSNNDLNGNGAAGTGHKTKRGPGVGARESGNARSDERKGDRSTEQKDGNQGNKTGETMDFGDERLAMTYLKEDEDLGIDWGTEEYEDCFTDSDDDSDDEESEIKSDATASAASVEEKSKGRMTEEHRKRLWAMHDALEARQKGKRGGGSEAAKSSRQGRNRTIQPPEEDDSDAEGSDSDVDPSQEELKKLARQLEAALPKVTRENMELLVPVLEDFGLASESLSDLLLKPGFGNFMSDQLSKRTGTLARRQVKFPVAAVGKLLREKGLRGRNIHEILASDKWENRRGSPSKVEESPGSTGENGVHSAGKGSVQQGLKLDETDRVGVSGEQPGEKIEGARLQQEAGSTGSRRSGQSSDSPAGEDFSSSDLMKAAMLLEKGFKSGFGRGSTDTASPADVTEPTATQSRPEVLDAVPDVETDSRSEPGAGGAESYSEAESEELKRQLGLSGATLEDIFKDGILDKEEAMKNLREQLAEFEKEVEADVYWGAKPEPIPDDDVGPAVDRKSIHPTDGPIQFAGEEMTLAELAEMAKLTPGEDPFEQPLVTQISSAEWEDVTADPSPLVIEVFATWARPCRTMAVEVATLARTMGERVRVVKLNAENEKSLAAALRVNNVPSIIFIRDHTVVMLLDSVVDLPGNDLVEIAEHVFFNGPFPECMKTAIERTHQQ